MADYETIVNKIVELSKQLKSEATVKNMHYLEESIKYRTEMIKNWKKFTPAQRADLTSLLNSYHTLESDRMKYSELKKLSELIESGAPNE